jgi:hypothetical protein
VVELDRRYNINFSSRTAEQARIAVRLKARCQQAHGKHNICTHYMWNLLAVDPETDRINVWRRLRGLFARLLLAKNISPDPHDLYDEPYTTSLEDCCDEND